LCGAFWSRRACPFFYAVGVLGLCDFGFINREFREKNISWGALIRGVGVSLSHNEYSLFNRTNSSDTFSFTKKKIFSKRYRTWIDRGCVLYGCLCAGK
jgi:hypothetical protein